MSHFCVVVVTKPGESIEKALQPYHEFECTGTDDEYVQDFDITADTIKEFEEDTVTRLRDQDGKLHEPYDDKFYRDPTPEESKVIGMGTGSSKLEDGTFVAFSSKDWEDGRGYRPKVRFVPDGYEEVEVSRHEAQSFRDFVSDWHGHKIVPFGQEPDLSDEHKYGYALEDQDGNITKVVNRTNPNRKWDWWTVGGRWQGYFRVKPDMEKDSSLGDPSWGNRVVRQGGQGYADQLPKGAIDWNAMCDERRVEANDRYDALEAATEGIEPPTETLEQCRERHGRDNIDKAREEYNSHPFMVAMSETRDERIRFWFGDVVKDFCVLEGGRDEYVRREINRVGVPFALVMNGKWYEKGEMGWFGMSHGDKDQDVWNREFHKLMDQLPNDTILTLVDCHI